MRPIDPAKMDKAIQLYVSGKPAYKAAAAVGIGETTLVRSLRRQGIEIRQRRIALDQRVLDEYTSGTSAYEISRKLGIERTVVSRMLREGGVDQRGRSAAGKLRASRLTEEQRRQQSAAAHDAVRGVPIPHERLVLKAQARQQRPWHPSRGERLLFDMLVERGEHPTPEMAVGKYNVDLAIADVAVEILGGEWHGYRSTHLARTKSLIDAGWHVMFVWDTATYPITTGASDQVHAFVEFARQNPSCAREYRVIRGDGELVASGRGEDYNLPYVPPARDLAN